MNWERWFRLPKKKDKKDKKSPIFNSREFKEAVAWAFWDIYAPEDYKTCPDCEERLISRMSGLSCVSCEYFKGWEEF